VSDEEWRTLKVALHKDALRRLEFLKMRRHQTYQEIVTEWIVREAGLGQGTIPSRKPQKAVPVEELERRKAAARERDHQAYVEKMGVRGWKKPRGQHPPKTRVTVPCATCKEPFEVLTSKRGHPLRTNCKEHRSQEGRNEYRRRVKCPGCGQSFQLRPGQPRTYGTWITPKKKRKPALCQECYAKRVDASAPEKAEVQSFA
jgi:hypothetical protein